MTVSVSGILPGGACILSQHCLPRDLLHRCLGVSWRKFRFPIPFHQNGINGSTIFIIFSQGGRRKMRRVEQKYDATN